MILVTGATGTVGRELVQQLLDAGESVRAMTRNPAGAQFDPRVEVVAGDFAEPETIEKAVTGAQKVFSLVFGPQTGIQEGNLAQAAKAAGVRGIVKLSAMGAGVGATVGIGAWHAAGEKAIRESGIPWTIVRPGGFMSNALFWRDSIRDQGKVFSNYGDGKVAYIHPRDIAAVAARALTESGHEGKIYELTGPEAISVGEQVRILSDAVGKPIEYVPITDEVARERMLKLGLPSFIIDALLPFASVIRSGRVSQVSPVVEQVTRRKPRTFADWSHQHALSFR
ncbi:MAG TPA: SDR family oxidoreductase [Verrucomicrobiae bacterium]|nr:SDR family oxidoreductase [Verrucomicrobiae bacterium]